MTKEKPCCVLCGQELGLFGKYGINFYHTTQDVCRNCQSRYTKADGSERDALDQRILSSRFLEDRATVTRNYEESRVRARAEAADRQERAKLALERKDRQKATLRCCDREMTALGVSTFQLGEHSFLLGDLDNLLSGSLRLALFRCDCCGQIKLLDPTFLNEE